MKAAPLFLTALFLAAAPARAAAPAVPFGAHRHALPPGMARPSKYDRKVLDGAVLSAYTRWKKDYLTQGCAPSRYYVRYKKGAQAATVSEAHGYGMIATALMAGADPQARQAFDGLYRYFRAHPSQSSPHLMAWQQDRQCRDINGPESATDGDLDIAYALLLADRQWGSCGAVNYRGEALKVIAAIQRWELGGGGRYTTLGSWARPGSPKHDATRPSDFMPGHFRAFLWASKDPVWKTLLDSGYAMIGELQAKHAPQSGLVPDFVLSPVRNARPARPGFLEGKDDGKYGYNACRVPWRLASDFAVSGDSRAGAGMARMARWAAGSPISGSPANVKAGYTLQGRATANWADLSFTAPLACAFLSGKEHQGVLDRFVDHVLRAAPEGYYGDSLKLLSLLVLSGNWWAPWVMPDPCK